MPYGAEGVAILPANPTPLIHVLALLASQLASVRSTAPVYAHSVSRLPLGSVCSRTTFASHDEEKEKDMCQRGRVLSFVVC